MAVPWMDGQAELSTHVYWGGLVDRQIATHLSTNWAKCATVTLIDSNVFPLNQATIMRLL